MDQRLLQSTTHHEQAITAQTESATFITATSLPIVRLRLRNDKFSMCSALRSDLPNVAPALTPGNSTSMPCQAQPQNVLKWAQDVNGAVRSIFAKALHVPSRSGTCHS